MTPSEKYVFKFNSKEELKKWHLYSDSEYGEIKDAGNGLNGTVNLITHSDYNSDIWYIIFSRVIFAWLAWRQPHLLLLDKPTNHLDIEMIDSLAEALNEWDGGLVLVRYDFRLINQVADEICGSLQRFQVNPANQKLDEFRWVMSWATAIPSRHMVTMLEVEFFPKWQLVLYHWLRASPNFEEVTQWYLGWKGIFAAEAAELLANDRKRYQLDIGLNMMNQAVEGMEVAQPGARENISYLRVTEQRQFEAQQKAAAYAQQQAAASMGSGVHLDGMGGVPEMSLKEIIEIHAQQHELLFKPKPGRSYNGLQIYGFGNISIYVDSLNQKVFAQTEAGWSLVSLDQLLEMHRKFAPKRR
ncbi:hypothetical protein MKW94_009264 [Papaver nudicaule]|uniref:GCF C-terminal domain-containing protein n=1 Tax=Papaver nudicaule TaxID=74823 RepID=A0AA41S271_PAPNU|nr:hypothetical protein [Papaver nudicaule]